MKTRTLLTLLLSAVLALPVLAQQAGSNSGADQTAAAPAKEASQHDSRNDFWDGDDPSVLALVLHPFAGKEYVKRHVQAVQDRVNELDQITTANTKMIKDVDARAQQGIQLASAKASMADEHATDATSKAQ